MTKETGGEPLECQLCGGPETQRHILCEFTYESMVKVRNSWRGMIVDRLGIFRYAEIVLRRSCRICLSWHTIFTGMLQPELLMMLHDAHSTSLLLDDE